MTNSVGLDEHNTFYLYIWLQWNIFSLTALSFMFVCLFVYAVEFCTHYLHYLLSRGCCHQRNGVK